MSNEGGSGADHDLLARLNALKKTHIDLDDKKYRIPVTAHLQPTTDLAPARALHNDLVSRFKSLNGTDSKSKSSPETSTSELKTDAAIAEEDAKTVEELLAELGGEGAWNFEKDEVTQIDDLLRSANLALNSQPVNPDPADSQANDLKPGNTYTHDLPSLDVEFSKPETDPPSDEGALSDNDAQPRKSKREIEADLDREADDLVAKLRDELKHAPPEPDSSEDEDNQTQKPQTTTLPDTPAFDLPTIPTQDPEPEPDLASRFASLTLPTTLPSTSTLLSAPSTRPAPKQNYGTSKAHNYSGHSSAEIDSWCIICLEDASLRCLGCDGDLYCAKCWIEGHRGPDAGYEERKHRAVEYNKDGKKKQRRRVAA